MVRAYNHICAADKCYNSRTTHPNKGFFGFPSDVQLCETWLTNCGRKDLSGQGVVKSNGYYKLCADHFEDKFFTDGTKTLLNRSLNPVPTIFVNNITTLLPPGSQAPTSDIDLPDLSDDEDASMYCETLINPYELMVESNRLPISFRFKSLCTRRDYDGETISQALLNLEPETELHQIDELCRFCMNKASNEYLELFAESSEVNEIRKICDEILPNKLEICDGLPYKVCRKCIGDLRTCHRLMEQFRHADQYLRAIAKYSLFIENEDDVKPVWEEEIDNFKEFIKPLPKKATVMPLKHFRPVVEGFKGYVEDVTSNTTLKSTDKDACTNGWSKKNDLSFDGIEADSQPIIIRSSDNDNSVSHILNNFPLPTTDMDLISERDLWQDDIDLICSNVIILPEKKVISPQEPTPTDTEKYINNNEMITSALTPNEDLDQTLNIHKIVNYFTNDENKSLEHFSINGTDITSDEFTSNPIKDINFEINLMNVKSLENQPDLTVSYKCLQCSDLFPTYSDLVDHVLDVHQIKPLPSPFTCEECAMQFDDATSLIQHIKEQHLAERIPCSLCPNQEGFKSMAELNRHRRDIHSIKCDKCDRLFYSQEKLDKHMNYKHDDRIVCSICRKVLSSVQGRKLHELTHTDRSEMCWICGVVVKNKQVLQKHMQRHGDETYPCDMCDKLFPSMLCLQRHKKGHSSTKADACFICHICPKSFGRKHHLNKHLLAHTKGQLFMCDFCGRGFRRNDKLMLHEAKRKALGGTCPVYNNPSFDRKGSSSLNIKTEEGSLECDVCGRKFLKAYNATRHKRYHFCQGNPEVIQKLLDEPEEYNCDKCGKQFFTKHTLQFHMATKHTGVSKPYACEFCPKRFRTRTQITMHERVHSGERRYACTECGKRFKTKTHLLHHESVHTEQKTHICPLCDAAFKSRSCLLEHTFYHKDAESVRPFQCVDCGNRFVSKSILKAHITKNHSSESLQEKENIQAKGVGYPCSVCGKILVNLIACKKHMRRMHRNISSIKTEEDIKTEYIETNDNETEDNVMEYIETEYIEMDYIETDYVETEDIETEDIETEDIETEDVEIEEIDTEDVEIEEIDTGDIETDNIETENIETEDTGTEDIETEDIETENVITEEYGVEVTDIETENVVIENYETETEDIETYIVTEDYGVEIEDVVTEVYGIEAEDLDENK